MAYKTIETSGMDELTNQMAKLEAYAQKDVIQKACKKSAKIVADEAKELAPEKSGQIKRAIRVRLGRIKRGGFSALAAMGRKWFTGEEFYGGFQEFGWKTGKRGSSNRKQIPGEHYMEHAFEEKGQEALDTLLVEIKDGMMAELGGK